MQSGKEHSGLLLYSQNIFVPVIHIASNPNDNVVFIVGDDDTTI